MICPNCEKEIELNIAQCPHCGCHFSVRYESEHKSIPVPLVEESPKVKSYEGMQLEIQDTVIEQKCPKCGKRIAVNMQFCKWCGSSLPQTQDQPSIILDNQPPTQSENIEENISANICKSCGRTINASALFCKWCGNMQ